MPIHNVRKRFESGLFLQKYWGMSRKLWGVLWNGLKSIKLILNWICCYNRLSVLLYVVSKNLRLICLMTDIHWTLSCNRQKNKTLHYNELLLNQAMRLFSVQMLSPEKKSNAIVKHRTTISLSKSVD